MTMVHRAGHEEDRWSRVKRFIKKTQPYAGGHIPEAGSQAWADLDDNDDIKMRAIGVAAERWVLEQELQDMRRAEAMKEASRAVLDGLKTARPTGDYRDDAFGAIDTREMSALFPYGGAA
ncbi:putative protein OS=Tsukamurella paurometabola (strain ATCC 8368 / DSM / CCUG 35730 /CIP 100753 / JCM 10117 / KCTC 9821 / NBRC 16120 / NCIMB 702349/ NCTC 13040) OX=521096 GN=Tpau_3889 PE=4 SV=1 [Tsukamurella paurometabola]|uniref:Uncharacterized protein n=1 Tax=Tsukamurella paurometabola (strain ATCC 8368 / DSM 20162 / CCUG 35730 / CIP 100753 / JCM 10117 / KCTC 9821 / NBRC 16120 / NCIMB 702349 / NCTC 13040) TaxID=521096 RepID=D5UMI8_TSUPD|nr:DUF2742 domain-containing protein [Tsukamurella paurometabola]ADG80462.1 hypothetical protein Tpau_3889 [Tsukamurella paurometabola DSM 20162]SUP39733.1 Protein of uncharacterised function (DUF2742) [Tsukamurella paurometabola]